MDSLREVVTYEDGTFKTIKDTAGPPSVMLIPGISIVEFNPVTEDEAIGLSLTVHYKEPGPAKPEEHLLFSEVSVEFLKGDGAYLIAPMDELAGLDEQAEKPLEGSLLSAEIGEGRHTHTALVLHHQLDKLTPGAFRLIANLLQGAKEAARQEKW